MNRKNLTAAVLAGLAGAAGIAGSATAQMAATQTKVLNPDGLGQVLIYPYYTTRNGNTTLLSVVNTTEDAKAVKVRFVEGKNSTEVLDFNLYMSPYDVWTAALLDGGVVDANCDIDNGLGLGENGQCGVPHLLTTDTTCTVPYLFESASTGAGLQSFLNFKLIDDNDGGGTDIDRTAEGHFEMIEMGVLTGDFAVDVTHVDGEPADCGSLTDAWTRGGTAVGGGAEDDGIWITAPSTDIDPPAGGLFGGAAVINVAEGYMFSYDAKAINGFQSDAEVTDATTLHAEPGTTRPSLNSGDVASATVFLDDGTTLVSPMFDATRTVDAVSYLFMHDQLFNEYSIEADINGFTEWVITFPTKRFYVWEGDVALPNVPPVAPFTEAFEDGEACENVSLENVFDREENTPLIPGTPGGPPVVSPRPPGPPPVDFIPFELCFETNVIEFAAADVPEVDPLGDDDEGTPILGAKNATTFELPEGYEAGWAVLELDDYREDITGTELSRDPLGDLEGLPVTGFAVQKFGNENASEGIAAFYGGIYGHKASRKTSS